MPYYTRVVADRPGAIDCGAWISAPGSAWQQPLTDEHFMIWILDGSAIVECEGRSYEIPPNGIFCAPPGVEYLVRWDPRRTTRWGWLNFTPDEPVELPRFRLARADDILIPLLNHMVALTVDRPPGWVGWSRVVFEYAVHVYATGQASTRIAHDDVYSGVLVRAIAAMQARWESSTMGAVSLADLAGDIGVSPRHLSRAFVKEIGVSPVTAIRMVRILRAAQLLSGTDRPIREIAGHVGFANPYHFSAVFKATIGVPPGEYRFHAPEQSAVPPQVERLFAFFRFY